MSKWRQSLSKDCVYLFQWKLMLSCSVILPFWFRHGAFAGNGTTAARKGRIGLSTRIVADWTTALLLSMKLMLGFIDRRCDSHHRIKPVRVSLLEEHSCLECLWHKDFPSPCTQHYSLKRHLVWKTFFFFLPPHSHVLKSNGNPLQKCGVCYSSKGGPTLYQCLRFWMQQRTNTCKRDSQVSTNIWCYTVCAVECGPGQRWKQMILRERVCVIKSGGLGFTPAVTLWI